VPSLTAMSGQLILLVYSPLTGTIKTATPRALHAMPLETTYAGCQLSGVWPDQDGKMAAEATGPAEMLGEERRKDRWPSIGSGPSVWTQGCWG
jgi:hypothetical protein